MRILAAILAVLISEPGVATQPDGTYTRLATALTTLQRYHTTGSLPDLQSAVDELFSAFVNVGQSRKELVAERRAVVSAYARVFHDIDQSYDPAFDPNDDRDLPSTAGGPANSLKSQRSARYIHLRNIDRGASVEMKIVLDFFNHLGTPPDTGALEDIIARAGLTRQRQQAIDAML